MKILYKLTQWRIRLLLSFSCQTKQAKFRELYWASECELKAKCKWKDMVLSTLSLSTVNPPPTVSPALPFTVHYTVHKQSLGHNQKWCYWCTKHPTLGQQWTGKIADYKTLATFLNYCQQYPPVPPALPSPSLPSICGRYIGN